MVDDNDDDAATVHSQAFYWEQPSFILPQEYDDLLDKRLGCPTLLRFLRDLSVDDGIKRTVKELVSADEDVDVDRALECMYRRRRAGTSSCPVSEVSLPKMEPVEVRDISGLRSLVSPSSGYMWKGGRLWRFALADMDADASSRVDVQLYKLDALRHLLEPWFIQYDTKYRKLRELFRSIVCKDSDSDKDVAAAASMTPVAWVRGMVQDDPRFNAETFVKDSRIGSLAQVARPFESADFSRALRAFVVEHSKLNTDFLFELRPSDDVLRLFLEANPVSDVVRLVHALSVLLSKACVLLRLRINAVYPNLAVWLHLMETLETEANVHVLSPFFPLSSVEDGLRDLGLLDEQALRLVEVLDKDKSTTTMRTRVLSTATTPLKLAPPPTPPSPSLLSLPPKPKPGTEPEPKRPAKEGVDVDVDDLTFSSIFQQLWSRVQK